MNVFNIIQAGILYARDNDDLVAYLNNQAETKTGLNAVQEREYLRGFADQVDGAELDEDPTDDYQAGVRCARHDYGFTS